MPTTWNRRSMLQGLSASLLAGSSMAFSVDGASTAGLTRNDLRNDVDIVRRALTLHPGLHRYATPQELAGWLEVFAREFVGATDEDTRFLALSRLLARIRCGHTYPSLYNQSRAVAGRLFARRTRLPFEFRWLEESMVVTRSYPGVDDLAPGSRILRLNGMEPRVLLQHLMLHARADGHNDAKRLDLLSEQGEDSIGYFDVFQSLLLPPVDGLHRLEALGPDGTRRRLALAAISPEDRQAQSRVPANDGTPYWQWEVRPDGIAVLTMPGWAMYSLKWKGWEAWLDDRLTALSGARALLIDLRANEGGEDVGDAILARLASRDLEFAAYRERVRFRSTPASLDPFLDTWDDSFRRLGEGGKALEDGFFQRPGSGDIETIAAKGPRVSLPVAALIGPGNSSATFQFALRARQSGLVKLIGQPTGGNLRGINGGCFFFVRLPASGLEFDLPLVGYFPQQPQPDAGLEPDIGVGLSWQDIASGRDAVMDAALAWAKSV